MRALSKREQFMAIVTFLIVGIGGGYYGLLLPIEKKIVLAQKETAVEKQNYMVDQKILEKAVLMNADYQFIKEYFYQNTTDESILAQFFSEIEEVAADLEMNINEIKPSKVQKSQDMNYFAVNLKIQCEMDQITEFMHILQSKPYYYSIDDLNMNILRGRGGSSLNIGLTLTKVLFY